MAVGISARAKRTKQTSVEPKPIIDAPPPLARSEIVTANAHGNTTTTSGWSVGKLFWGYFLVITGTLLMLDNSKIVDIDVLQLWRMWPLDIILGGLSLLSVRGMWLKIVIVVSLLTLAAVVMVALGYTPISSAPVRDSSGPVERESSEVSRLQTSIKSAAGNLTVHTDEAEALVTAVLKSDVATLRQVSRRENNVQSVDLSTEFQRGGRVGDIKNDLKVAITDDALLELTVDTGALKTDIYLEQAMLERLTLKARASTVKVRLGSRLALSRINLDAGASSVEVTVPQNAGVRIRLERGLASADFDDLDAKGDGVFESANYDQANHKIEVSANIGTGSIRLIRN